MNYPGQSGMWGQMPNNNYHSQWTQNGYYNQLKPNQDNVKQVTGPESAKAYPMGPNSREALFHETQPIFYFKQTDSSGYPTIEGYRFEKFPEWEENPNQPDMSEYVTKKDLLEVLSQIGDTTGYATKEDLEKLKADLEKWVIDNA